MISKEAEFIRQTIRQNSISNQTLNEARENMKNMRTVIKFSQNIKQMKLNINNVKCELFYNLN